MFTFDDNDVLVFEDFFPEIELLSVGFVIFEIVNSTDESGTVELAGGESVLPILVFAQKVDIPRANNPKGSMLRVVKSIFGETDKKRWGSAFNNGSKFLCEFGVFLGEIMVFLLHSGHFAVAEPDTRKIIFIDILQSFYW